MSEKYRIYNTNEKAHAENKRIHISKDEADHLRRQELLRVLGDKHESRFTLKQKAIALGATGLMALAVLTGVKEADRYNTAKTHNPDLTSLEFAGSEAKAGANTAIHGAQELFHNDIEAGGTYKIKKGEHNTFQIAEDLAKKYSVSINPNAVADELEKLNPDLRECPPQPGVRIVIPKDVMDKN